MSPLLKIEKDVPPPERFGQGRRALYPYRDMEIGDSFLVPCEDWEVETVHRRITASYHQKWMRGKGLIFSARKQANRKGQIVGIRVWRIA